MKKSSWILVAVVILAGALYCLDRYARALAASRADQARIQHEAADLSNNK